MTRGRRFPVIQNTTGSVVTAVRVQVIVVRFSARARRVYRVPLHFNAAGRVKTLVRYVVALGGPVNVVLCCVELSCKNRWSVTHNGNRQKRQHNQSVILSNMRRHRIDGVEQSITFFHFSAINNTNYLTHIHSTPIPLTQPQRIT